LKDGIAKAQREDGPIDPLLFTQFADKVTIIRRSSFADGNDTFADELKKIQSLRDHLAHANDYAASPEAAAETCRIVRSIDQWNERFLRWLGSSKLETAS
jgi:hypothetical protein